MPAPLTTESKAWLIGGLLALIALILLFARLSSQPGETPVQPEPTASPAVVTPTTPSPTPPLGASGPYPVAQVVDGDTIKIDLGGVIETIRIVGLNTPETVDPRRPVGCFGREASEQMKQRLLGQQVWTLPDPTQSDRDRYSRLLRFVFLEDGSDAGLAMIREGFGTSENYGSAPHAFFEQYQTAEAEAREQQRGLWSPEECPVATPTPQPSPTPTPTQQSSASGNWVCNCQKTCATLSCAEAQYQLNVCGCS